MRWIEPNRRAGSRLRPNRRAARGACAAAWLAAAVWAGGRAEAAPHAPLALGDEAMDAVTAGQLHMELELAATADGPTASTATTGSIAIARTTTALVALDPSAPAEARARLLGVAQAEVGLAAGSADASGAQDKNCSAKVGVTGADYIQTTQTQAITGITANCSCAAMAVNVLSH